MAQSGFKKINVALLFTLSEAKQSCERRYFFSDKFIAHIYRKSSRDFLVNLWFAIFMGTLIFCLTSERKEGRKRNHELRVRHQWGKRGRNLRSPGGKKKLFLVVDIAKKEEKCAARICHSKKLRQSFENNQMLFTILVCVMRFCLVFLPLVSFPF